MWKHQKPLLDDPCPVSSVLLSSAPAFLVALRYWPVRSETAWEVDRVSARQRREVTSKVEDHDQ